MFSPFLPTQTRPSHWWLGESGERHIFSVFELADSWDFDAIVYIPARARHDGLYDPLYIGQSGEGATRLSHHEKYAPALRLGLTHVHVLFESNRRRRLDIETDLRRRHWTPLNEQPTPAMAPLDVGGLGALSSLTGLEGLPSAIRPFPWLPGLDALPAPIAPVPSPTGLEGLAAAITPFPPTSLGLPRPPPSDALADGLGALTEYLNWKRSQS
jgi:hypothetical protein